LSGAERVTIDSDTLRSEARDHSIRTIDVRKEAEYRQDHLPGAVNIPLANLLRDDSSENVIKMIERAGIDDEMPVAVYDDTFGALASRMAWALEYLGHGQVSLLDTTYSGWKTLGLESSHSIPDVQPKRYSAELRPEILATSGYLEEAKEFKKTTLLDNRERLNYLEQHIPGAINIPYRTLAADGKILRSPAEMKRLFENRGISPSNEIITYCGSVGTLSGLAYYALKSISVPNIRLYVKSFREWKSLEKPTTKQEYANYWDLSAE